MTSKSIDKFKNVEDLKEIVKDKTVNELLNGSFDDTSVSKLLDLMKKVYIDEIKYPKEVNIINYRITKYNLWIKLTNTIKNSYLSNFYIKMLPNDQFVYWQLLTSKVLKREIFNFPIMYYTNNRYSYFESFNTVKYDLNLIKTIESDVYSEIVFQKLIIMYNLYSNNLNSCDFKFIIVPINKSNVCYEINGLYFKLNIKYLVLLDYNTELNSVKGLEESYISYLGLSGNKFLKTFILYFRNYLNIDHLSLANNISNVINNNISHMYEGKICIYQNFNNNNRIANIGIIVETLKNRCNVLLFIPGKQVLLTEINTTPDNLFEFNYFNNPIFDNILIGKKNCYSLF